MEKREEAAVCLDWNREKSEGVKETLSAAYVYTSDWARWCVGPN
jgi:hypothetical protein